MVEGGKLPGSQHLDLLPDLAVSANRCCLEGGWDSRCPAPPDEPRRRPCHVGSEVRPETLAPASYTARSRGWRRDVWAILHPPYTAWHLSYVLIGAGLAPSVDGVRLIATVLAFFLAVGISAHALDELKGRPLRTELPSAILSAAALFGLVGAVALGVA